MFPVNHTTPELEAWIAARANPKWKRKYVWKPKAAKVVMRQTEKNRLYREHNVTEHWDYRVTGGARAHTLEEFMAVKGGAR